MKLTLSTFSCRMLVLLAIATPAVFMTGRAGAATLQPETNSLNELQSSSSDVNFAANTTGKVQALLSEKQLLAKKDKLIIKFKQHVPSFQSTTNSASPSAIDVFQSVAEDTLS